MISLITKIMSQISPKLLGVGIGILIVLFGWFYVSNLKSERDALQIEKTQLESDKKQLQDDIKKIDIEHKKEIENYETKLENQKITFQEKEVVINSNSKLKQEIAKRGEVKDEDNFISFGF